MERLQKKIAESGYCSRRKAEELIANKKVKVNGKIIDTLGFKVSNNDKIMIGNKLIKKEEKVYFLLNKPKGIISSANDEKNRTTVIDLVETDKRIYPVGRLDYNTRGILLLTNDGELANLIMHPKNEVEKVYSAKIEGFLSGKDIAMLKAGVRYKGELLKALKIKVRSKNKTHKISNVEITVTEGKNHEIKNMFKALNHEVKELKRLKIAFLDLTNLKEGEYRPLKFHEVKKLYGEIKTTK